MTYKGALQYLQDALTFGIKPGLERMRSLLKRLEHPERRLAYIHVAGTNGKGSVSTYLTYMLAQSGKKVGLFTSPYLERFTERIRIVDGVSGLKDIADDEAAGEISKEAVARLVSSVACCVDDMLTAGEEHPTEFELITAIAMLWFAEQRCDIVVLETGLGGRLDSTNVITKPVACVITALGYDHTDRLGSSMEEIAAEKAGIIKDGCPVYLYDPHEAIADPKEADAVLRVVREHCRARRAPLSVIGRERCEMISRSLAGQLFRDRRDGQVYKTSLLGAFQPLNAILAIAVLESVVPCAQRVQGIEQAKWPGRLELLNADMPVLIDGAHNPQGCSALGNDLRFFFRERCCSAERHARRQGLLHHAPFRSGRSNVPCSGVYCDRAGKPTKTICNCSRRQSKNYFTGKHPFLSCLCNRIGPKLSFDCAVAFCL